MGVGVHHHPQALLPVGRHLFKGWEVAQVTPWSDSQSLGLRFPKWRFKRDVDLRRVIEFVSWLSLGHVGREG